MDKTQEQKFNEDVASGLLQNFRILINTENVKVLSITKPTPTFISLKVAMEEYTSKVEWTGGTGYEGWIFHVVRSFFDRDNMIKERVEEWARVLLTEISRQNGVIDELQLKNASLTATLTDFEKRMVDMLINKAQITASDGNLPKNGVVEEPAKPKKKGFILPPDMQ
jgi:hypothetical protein